MTDVITARSDARLREAAPAWPRRPGPVLDWLMTEGRHLADTGELLAGLCRQLLADGLPLARCTVHVRTLHPQVLGERFVWQRDTDAVEQARVDFGVLDRDSYLRSPVRVLFEGAGGFRQRLDLGERRHDFPLLDELAGEGLTDYVAIPIAFSDGRTHAGSFATDRPGGFTTEELVAIDDLMPPLGAIIEIQALRRIGTYLLDTYVGHRAGERILKGQIRRGSGETIHAAIWYADLRGFTSMSERLERDELIDSLNAWFDVITLPVERHGGEVLKFIGDGLLAVFPIEGAETCRVATRAAFEAREAMRELNAERIAHGLDPLDYGLALHVGDVMYGNIGARDRLDFTVIGPAVNLAARLEGLSRRLGHQVLVSHDFAAQCGCALVPLGRHELRGIARSLDVFTLPEQPTCP